MISLGPIGLASSNPYTDDAAVVADEARRVEGLGFSTLWRSGNLPMLDAAVRATTTIPVATGIIPVDSVPVADVITTYRSLQHDRPGRFIVGLGGALGANMLALARDRAGGAYPFLVTPSYVTDARATLGADKTLAVLLMVMPTT